MTESTANQKKTPAIALLGTALLRWLWNPFEKTAGGPALAIGALVLLATGFVAYPSKTHFDGVLDTHVGLPAPLLVFVGESIVNWLSLVLVLWIGGILLTRGKSRFRALDLFGTQALARWPFLLIALFCLLPGFQSYSEKLVESAMAGNLSIPMAPAGEMIAFWGGTILMLLVTIWFVALAWKSFRISCDVSGGKAVAAFIVGILVAEVISKIAILKGLALLA
jgi:hypothetical protein